MSGAWDVVPKTISALKDVPLWLLSGFSIAGLILLAVPSIVEPRSQFLHTSFGIGLWAYTVVCCSLCGMRGLSIVSQNRKARSQRNRSRNRRKYFELYLPLFRLTSLMQTESSQVAPWRRRRSPFDLAADWFKNNPSRTTVREGVSVTILGGTHFPLQEIRSALASRTDLAELDLINLVQAAVVDRSSRSKTDLLSDSEGKLYHYIRERFDELHVVLDRN